MMEINKIYNENCLDTMAKMPDGFVDLVVSSPPYDSVRDYNGYTFDFEPIARELYRVTKNGGIIAWIVGDGTIDGGESGTSFRQALYFKDIGFRLYDTMIYEKAGTLPNTYRYGQAFEYMFILSKGKPKTIHLLRDKPNKWAGHSTFGNPSIREANGALKKTGKRIVGEFGIRNNIWRYANGFGFGQKDKIAYKHPATMPELLAQDHILSWSDIGDLVYDPFMGSGTTAKMALLNGRNWLGSEISGEYCAIITERLSNYKETEKNDE